MGNFLNLNPIPHGAFWITHTWGGQILGRFWADSGSKYDVTDAILQYNEKMKVQYLRNLLFDLFETLQAVRTWQRNFASFQILLLWQPESKLLSIIEKTKGLLFEQK